MKNNSLTLEKCKYNPKNSFRNHALESRDSSYLSERSPGIDTCTVGRI